MKKKVLLTSGYARKCLGAVKSLRKRGIETTVGDYSRLGLALWSKYCDYKIIYPSPDKEPNKFLDFILKYLSRNKQDLLFPTGSQDSYLFSKYKKDIEKITKVAVPDYGIISKAINKAETLKIAKIAGVPIPQTFFINSLEEVNNISIKLKYPVLIKPKIGGGGSGISIIESSDDLCDKYYQTHKFFEFPIIQEYIPSNECGYSCSAIFDFNSNPITIFSHRRLREYPINAGPSTIVESIKSQELENYTIKLLKELKWYGVAMVEYRLDSRDNGFKLIEINPRLWGSSRLAIDCGLDFPYLLFRLYTGINVEPNFSYKVGLRRRWLFPADILHFITNPKRFSMKPSFFNLERKITKLEFFDYDDFGPTMGNFLWICKNIFSLETWKKDILRTR